MVQFNGCWRALIGRSGSGGRGYNECLSPTGLGLGCDAARACRYRLLPPLRRPDLPAQAQSGRWVVGGPLALPDWLPRTWSAATRTGDDRGRRGDRPGRRERVTGLCTSAPPDRASIARVGLGDLSVPVRRVVADAAPGLGARRVPLDRPGRARDRRLCALGAGRLGGAGPLTPALPAGACLLRQVNLHAPGRLVGGHPERGWRLFKWKPRRHQPLDGCLAARDQLDGHLEVVPAVDVAVADREGHPELAYQRPHQIQTH